MKLGVHYWNYTTPADPAAIAPTLAETARIVEEAGASSFTVMDHFFQMEGMADVDEPMLEGYTTLGYVAARTERMTLGLLVTGVMYRHPGLLMTPPPLEDPDAWLAAAEAYARLGVKELQTMPDRHPVEFANGIAEQLMPRLTGIGPV